DGTAAVEILREQDVLGHGDGVLQQPVHQDDVDPSKGLAIPDGLFGDLAYVRDALQLELSRLDAAAAAAQVAGDHAPLTLVKRAVHGDGRLLRSGGRRRLLAG